MNIRTLFTLVFCLFAISLYSQNPIYCNSNVFHFAGDPPSEIILTIQNTGPNSMEVVAESADASPVDFLLVPSASGAMISPGMETTPGVWVVNLTWAITPPSDVFMNVLWSKTSSPGNWQLSPGDFAYSFNTTCAGGPPVSPDPTCDPADVISMFSDSYTDVPVDTWLTVWSAPPVTLTDTDIAGNAVKLYEDVTFLGIETVGPNLIDASGMNTFNIDFYSENATQFRIKLVDFGADMNFGGGDDTEHEITVDNPTLGEWVTFSIPLSDFTNLLNTNNIAQLILSAMPNTVADFYIDNVYYANSACSLQPPPDPICDQADVISMFSNVYTDVTVDTWLTPWSAAPVTLTDLQLAGNDVKFYQDVTFLGIETVGPNLIDASAMSDFNIDFYSDNATQFRIKLVDFGADQNFGGGDDTEHEITIDNPTLGEWNTFKIPLSDFTNLLNTNNIAQLILSAMPNTVADFYIDNVYYSNANCVDPSPYCDAVVPHFAGDACSEIVLTIKNIGASAMVVTASSADADPIDALIVPGPASGAMISPSFESAPGELSVVLSWAGAPPADVLLNVLWSKVSFGGNWQLSTTDVSIPFDAGCPLAGQSPYCATQVPHFAGDAGSDVLLTIQNKDLQQKLFWC